MIMVNKNSSYLRMFYYHWGWGTLHNLTERKNRWNAAFEKPGTPILNPHRPFQQTIKSQWVTKYCWRPNIEAYNAISMLKDTSEDHNRGVVLQYAGYGASGDACF